MSRIDISEHLLREEESVKTQTGLQRIAEERTRQLAKYDLAHDQNEHDGGQLALAAALLATPDRLYDWEEADPWPFWDYDPRARLRGQILPNHHLDPEARVEQLAMAGALIAAEIDRLSALLPAKKE